MYPITITLHNAAQLGAVQAALDNLLDAKEQTGAPPAKKSVQKEAPAPTPATAAPAAAPEPKAENSAPAAAGEQRTIDEAKALTIKIVSAKGREAAVNLLSKYGVPVAAKLAADQVTPFVLDAEKVLAS